MNPRFTTIISSILLGSVVLLSCPLYVSAQNTTAPSTAKQVGVDNNGQPIYEGKAVNQASTYREGIESGKGVSASAGAAEGIGSAIGCSAGQILGNLIVSSITSLLQDKATETITEKLTEDAVPANIVGKVRDNSNVATHAEFGSLTIGGVLSGASWNAIAWCLVNAIIEYIANATIAWANSGFNGNPAFVDNPEQFFTDLADQEAASFIQEIVGQATNGAINVCEPFKIQIAVNLSRAYGAQGQRRACTLDGIVNNYNSFVNGSFKEGGWNGWFALTQNDANNAYGSYIMNNDLLYAKIAKQNNTANLELGWNKGFLSFQSCEDKKDKSTCKTTTPGTLIQSSLEKTLGLPKDRLVLAEKFDQMVSAIVENLIRVALNEVLSSGESQ